MQVSAAGAPGVPRRALMLTPDVYYLDRRIVQEAGTLAARGSKVDVYLTNPAFDPGDVALPQGVRILPNPSASRPASGLPLRLRYVKSRLRETAPPLHRVADWGQHRFTDRAGSIERGNAGFLEAQEPYDMVFGHDVPVWPLAARLARRWDCAMIVDLHDIYPEMVESFSSATARAYWRAVEARCIRDADAILCVNEAVRDYVEGRYGPDAERFVISNAVPFAASPSPDRDVLRESYGIDPAMRILLFAGVPRANMNLENLILGFGRAALEGWELAFLGVGPANRRLESIVRSHGLADRVRLGLSVPQADLIAVASTATAGVLPYQAVGYNHLIATPNKLFEYIQARLPVVTSPLPMVVEVIEHHGIGGVADLSTPTAAARDLRRFIDQTLPVIGPAALETAARGVCWEAEEDALVAAVRSAARHDRARRGHAT